MAASVFEVYEDKKKEWRWRLRHSNKKILADSGESYTRRQDAVRAVAGMKVAVADAEVQILGCESECKTATKKGAKKAVKK